MTPKSLQWLGLKDEKIMSIQKFAYQLAQKIQTEHAVKISRSHIYELIALNQGYRSYNSFVAKNILLNCEYDSSEEYHEHELLNLLTFEIFKHPPKTDYLNYDDENVKKRILLNLLEFIVCDTVLPLICSNLEPTYGLYKSFWDITTSKPP